MKRPLLLGLNNPYGGPPGAALLPRPRGSAGYRLFTLSGLSWTEYQLAFDRRNIVDVEWDDLLDRTVVVLGKEAWRRLQLPGRAEFFDRVFTYQIESKFILIPHPSGRNLWYNSSPNRLRVSRLLRRLARTGLLLPRS